MLRFLLTFALAGSVVACRNTAPAFGSSPESAVRNAEQFWGGLGDRFNNVVRHPRYNAARIKLAHNALAPSRVFDDTTIWTSTSRDERILQITAGFDGERYFAATTPAAPAPQKPADARHVMRLRKVGDEEYRWTTDVDFGIGQITAREFAEVYASMLQAAVTQPEVQLRSDYRSTIPRGAGAMGRLFRIDSLRATPLPDGTATLTFVTRMEPRDIRSGFPHFSSFLERYIRPARYRLTLTDRRGARWMEMWAANYVLHFRLRATPDGRMAPLDGNPRPFPRDLYLRGEAEAKIRIFTVGVRELIADVRWINEEHERGWLLRFQRPPEWDLPPLVATMLKTPLRRPFEKGGFTFRIAVRDAPGQQTVIARQIDGTVRESGILRWLSSLSGTAMSDYVGPSEVEENRFVMEAFYGLRADFRALGGSAPGVPVRKEVGTP